MAHFYGEMRGQRESTVTKCGTKDSGITAHIRGWNTGVKIYCYVDSDGNDCIEIHETGGSRKDGNIRKIATIKGGKV